MDMYDKKTLPNGVRIVSEPMPHVKTAAVGVWVGSGSRFEGPGENGAAHFIEHMLFKGTATRSAAELADLMDGVGGQINAFTSRENTCYYARVLESHLDTAIDLLGDMFFHSRMAGEDVQNERGVILEEIGMYQDTPEDMVSERLTLKCFPGALGRPVLGTARSLPGLSPERLRGFMERTYIAPRIVVSLSGSFSAAHLDRLSGLFAGLPAVKDPGLRRARYSQAFTVKRKAVEQNHLCLGFPGLRLGDPDRYAAALMSSILGGGMSSRLFQNVREKHGLCYSVYSFGSEYLDAGVFGVVTATGRDSEEKALNLIMEELRRLKQDGVTPRELDRAREQTKASLLMALESTTSRMNRLGFGELMLGKSTDPEELIAKYDAVTPADILLAAGRLLDFSRMSVSAVGRVREAEAYRAYSC